MWRVRGWLAKFHHRATPAYWSENWAHISEEKLRHILRPTKRVGNHARFFRRRLPQEGVVLEAGCGTGLWVRRLREHGYNCIGLDFAISSLASSKAVCNALPLIGGDVLNLPFADGSLAAYLSFGVVEHFEGGPGPALREAARVLRPGGVALISVPYKNRLRQHLTTISEDEARARGLEFYHYYFTRQDMDTELTLAGLCPINTFHGYGVVIGLAGKSAWFASLIRRLPRKASLLLSEVLDRIPYLLRLAAHMVFTVAIKP